MDAQRIMSLEVVTVPPELSLQAAHQLMLDRGLRHLPVVAGQKLAGILSDRDLLLAIGGSQGAFIYPPSSVGEVMSLAPVSAAPDASIAELARTMMDAKIDALPIINSRDVLLGLVTSTDLMRILSRWLPQEPQPTLSFQIRRAADLQAHA